MTTQERCQMLNEVEKPAYRSKKFAAWFIQQGVMGAMAVVALLKQPDLGWPLATFMVSLVFFMGISTMWYLGKQAATDIAVRGFAMIGAAAPPLGKKED